MTYNKIMERLQHDYAVTRAKYEVLGVFSVWYLELQLSDRNIRY